LFIKTSGRKLPVCGFLVKNEMAPNIKAEVTLAQVGFSGLKSVLTAAQGFDLGQIFLCRLTIDVLLFPRRAAGIEAVSAPRSTIVIGHEPPEFKGGITKGFLDPAIESYPYCGTSRS
jgi:hypothetical protein